MGPGFDSSFEIKSAKYVGQSQSTIGLAALPAFFNLYGKLQSSGPSREETGEARQDGTSARAAFVSRSPFSTSRRGGGLIAKNDQEAPNGGGTA